MRSKQTLFPEPHDMNSLVSIIIPTSNRCDLLKSCLRSIRRSTYHNYETIVINNGSSDGTEAMVQSEYSDVQLIETERNLFAARGRNLGVRKAHGEYLLFIDDDNEIDPKMIEELVSLFNSDLRIGLAGPKMYYCGSKNLLWWTGASIDLLTSRTNYRGLNCPDIGQYDHPTETGHIPNVVMVKRDVYDLIGGFDEVYKMSYSESDFAMRAIRKGYKVMYCPQAVTYHNTLLPGRSASLFKVPMRAYFFARNRVIYMKKFSSIWQFWVFMIIFFPSFTIYYLSKINWIRDFTTIKMHLLGTRDGIIYGITGKIPALPEQIID